jgi:hypothetical protein
MKPLTVALLLAWMALIASVTYHVGRLQGEVDGYSQGVKATAAAWQKR